MNILWICLTVIVAFVFGVFGWCQIVGCIRHFREMGGRALITISIWVVILGALTVLAQCILPSDSLTAYYVTLGISLFLAWLYQR